MKTDYDTKIGALEKDLKAEKDAHADTKKKLGDLEAKVPGATTTTTQQKETDPTNEPKEEWTPMN